MPTRPRARMDVLGLHHANGERERGIRTMTTRRDFLQMTAMAAGCVVSFPRNAFPGRTRAI